MKFTAIFIFYERYNKNLWDISIKNILTYNTNIFYHEHKYQSIRSYTGYPKKSPLKGF